MSVYASGRRRYKDVKFLDEKHCFELWAGMGRGGSYLRVQRALEREGVVNPYTGRPPSRPGIWLAVWRYVVLNADEVRPIFEKAYMESGDVLTEDDWLGMLCRHSREAFAKGTRNKLLRSLGITPEMEERYMIGIAKSTIP